MMNKHTFFVNWTTCVFTTSKIIILGKNALSGTVGTLHNCNGYTLQLIYEMHFYPDQIALLTRQIQTLSKFIRCQVIKRVAAYEIFTRVKLSVINPFRVAFVLKHACPSLMPYYNIKLKLRLDTRATYVRRCTTNFNHKIFGTPVIENIPLSISFTPKASN